MASQHGDTGSNQFDLDQDAAPTSDRMISDLAQLETSNNNLHIEADRFKCLGNKQMAQQKYEDAYESYSRAIEVSSSQPAAAGHHGRHPESHVFFSNRAAACLSLKRYSDAVVDAQQSIAFQPTFSKAQARLGQALYFSRRYEESILAYEKALELDEHQGVERSDITVSYLQKAEAKYEKQLAKQQQQQQKNTKVQDQQQHSQQQQQKYNNFRIPSEPVNSDQIDYFHRKAATHLSRQEYELGLKDYNAALRLLEDEPPQNVNEQQHCQLLVHRATCLCGTGHYESSAQDAREATQRMPSHFAGYSILGRALFYLDRYEEALAALTESLSLAHANASSASTNNKHNNRFAIASNQKEIAFDEQLWAKCKQALREQHQPQPKLQSLHSVNNEEAPASSSPTKSSSVSIARSSGSIIPKLKPPRFVPREQAMTATPNLKRMPKNWPTQYNPTFEDNFLVGPERQLVIHDGGGMGMKLHRGTDGFVRVLSTTPVGDPNTGQAKLAPREGSVDVGDVIREVAGVDLRRPITNPMWGDTVTLIKMTQRPITFVVAPEMSLPPLSVQEEMRKTQAQESLEAKLRRKPSAAEAGIPPSPALVGELSVEDFVRSGEYSTRNTTGGDDDDLPPYNLLNGGTAVNERKGTVKGVACAPGVEFSPLSIVSDDGSSGVVNSIPEISPLDVPTAKGSKGASSPFSNGDTCEAKDKNENANAILSRDIPLPSGVKKTPMVSMPPTSEPEREARLLNGLELLWESSTSSNVSRGSSSSAIDGGWTKKQWEQSRETRSLLYCSKVTKVAGNRKTSHVNVDAMGNFGGWLTNTLWGGDNRGSPTLEDKLVMVFENPSIIVIARRPRNEQETESLVGVNYTPSPTRYQKQWVMETILDPVVCKFRVSHWTTPTSIPSAALQSSSSQSSLLQQQQLKQQIKYPHFYQADASVMELISPRSNFLFSRLSVDTLKERATTAVTLHEQQQQDAANSPYNNWMPSYSANTSAEEFLDTCMCETVLTQTLLRAHGHDEDNGTTDNAAASDYFWRHQIILGTLHSHVVVRSHAALERSLAVLKALELEAAAAAAESFCGCGGDFDDSSINIDALDERGYTALHLACLRRSHEAVNMLGQSIYIVRAEL
jgi:tetratricopeptide (TPR) repeat protein